MVTTKEFSTSGQEPAPGLKTYKVVVGSYNITGGQCVAATVRGIEIVAVGQCGKDVRITGLDICGGIGQRSVVYGHHEGVLHIGARTCSGTEDV